MPGLLITSCSGSRRCFRQALSVFDTYHHVERYPFERYRPQKVAVLDKPENKGINAFQEMAGRNRGIFLKYFHALDQAKLWLDQ
jgi:hypothetical protein